MNRYEQRRQKRLQNPAIAAGYREMAAEFQLIQALERIRAEQCMSKEVLATKMGKRRETVSRLLTDDNPNPTLTTVVELLTSLGVTADVTLRRSKAGEAPIHVDTESDLITASS